MISPGHAVIQTAEHGRGAKKLRLYLESKEGMGVISDFLVDVQGRRGHLHFYTHIRTLRRVLAPEVEKISAAHDFIAQWTVEPQGWWHKTSVEHQWTWKRVKGLKVRQFRADEPLRVSILLVPAKDEMNSAEDLRKHGQWVYRVRVKTIETQTD